MLAAVGAAVAVAAAAAVGTNSSSKSSPESHLRDSCDAILAFCEENSKRPTYEVSQNSY